MSLFTVKQNKEIDEKYYYLKHKSGLDLYVVPKKLSTGYAVFGTRFGSIDSRFSVNGKEFQQPDGIAHFLEHKMFENEDGVDTFQRYAKFGANANAYTSSDRTVYLFSAAGHFLDSLSILLDFVSHPYFTKDTVEKEQGIIGQEIRMYDDNPNWRLYFNMLRALYVNHPAKIDTAGTVESIAQITPQSLYDAYHAFYNLHNMALCVCADVEPEAVKKVADRILQESPKLEVKRFYPEEPDRVVTEKVTQKMSVSMPMFSIGIKDTDFPCEGEHYLKKQAEYEILLDLMFGKSSPFYARLYEKGVINSAFSFGYEGHSNFGLTEISGYSAEPERVYEEVLKEFEQYARTGFEDQEFERTKRAVYAKNIRVFNSTEDIANDFLSFVFANADLLDYPQTVQKVTLTDLQQRFARLNRRELFVLSTVLPTKEEKA